MMQKYLLPITILAFTSMYIPANAQSGDPFDAQKFRVTQPAQAVNMPVSQTIRYTPTPEAATFIRKPFTPSLGFGENASIFENHDAAVAYLNYCSPELGITDLGDQFVVSQTKSDALQTTHIRMHQVYKGIPVVGGELILHARNQSFEMVNGTCIRDEFPEKLTPSVSMQSALKISTDEVKQHSNIRELTAEEKSLLRYAGATSSLVFYNLPLKNISNVLAWHIILRPNFIDQWELFVDAQTGFILHSSNKTCAADGPKTTVASDINSISRNINTYQIDTNYYLIDGSKSIFNPNSLIPARPEGAMWTLDALNTEALTISQVSNTDNSSWSPKAVSAHYNASTVFDYFKNTHGQTSIDNQGGNMVSIINVTLPGGVPLDNLFWNGQALLYGNGNVQFRPLVGSLDLAGHEFTHGIIQTMANLDYQGQSGAINESLADVFGCMLDKGDWLIGEDVVKSSAYPSGALRNMQEPHNGTTQGNLGWQPNHMSEYYTGTDDNGGVHLNSGILNKAYYTLSNTITANKAEKIYFRVLSTYLTRHSGFYDLRDAVIQAAADLYGGLTSPEVTAAKAAFDLVGIFDNGNGLNYALDLQPIASGTDKLLTYDPNYFNTSRHNLYLTDGTNPTPLSNTPARCIPSVTDNGSFCVFVDTLGKIRKMDLVGPPNETILSPGLSNFAAVAVSKDGSKLAAVTTLADTSMYIYSFQSNSWTQFKVYHQTKTQGVNSPGLQFIGSLEWDYSGEQVLFDARYTLGDSLHFWDIGTIHVWNNQTNSSGSGRVTKLISQLPTSVSIGNPRFARNSPYIITYDWFNRIDSTFAIMAKNLLTGASGLITTNNMLGNPTYDRTDQYLIYSTYDGSLQDTAIWSIELSGTKIEASGAPNILVPHQKWMNWLAFGDRKLYNTDKALISFQLTSLNPKVSGILIGDSVLLRVPETAVLTNQTADFVTSPFSVVDIGTTRQFSGTTKNNFTSPVIYRVIARDNTAKQYTIIAQKPGNSKEITAFSFPDLSPVVHGEILNDTITLRVPNTTDVTLLRAVYTASAFAKVKVNNVVQQSGVTINDFFEPVIYNVTAYDSTERNYTVIVKFNTGLNDLMHAATLNLYPNPTHDRIYFGIKGKVNYAVLDMYGREVMFGATTEGNINASNLAQGAYIVRIEQDGSMYTGKLFKLD
ncbi:MAG: M4 family metallopeptidase [Bacteroidia bacterium]|jgi:Zn-dependent metalloprotease